MKTEKRKQMLSDYKNHRTDMGVFSVQCTATGDSFIGWAADTKALINRTRFQLELGSHPNRTLQTLWNLQGEAAFVLSVIEELPYDEKDPDQDYTELLEALCAGHIARMPQAARLK